MKIILRLKAWQLLVLCFALVLISFIDVLSDIGNLFGIFVYFWWVFSIGYIMHSFICLPSKPKIIYFKISLLVMSAIVISSFFISLDKINEYLEWILIVLSLWASFYSFMFAARMLESVKRGEIATRSDSLRTFFYICFFPIGFWLLQPSINRILAEQESTPKEEAETI